MREQFSHCKSCILAIQKIDLPWKKRKLEHIFFSGNCYFALASPIPEIVEETKIIGNHYV
jgi:hypothetical protein